MTAPTHLHVYDREGGADLDDEVLVHLHGPDHTLLVSYTDGDDGFEVPLWKLFGHATDDRRNSALLVLVTQEVRAAQTRLDDMIARLTTPHGKRTNASYVRAEQNRIGVLRKVIEVLTP